VLTADLVRARTRRGRVEPFYIDAADPEHGELARRMIDIFDRHTDRARRELDSELRDFLGTGTAFALHRGLAKLLLDRCEFETRASIAPEELREAVFAKAAERHREADAIRFPRAEVVAATCERLGIPAEELERSLYADLKSEQVLVRFRSCRPDWLLRRYNVALAQGVLLRATRLVVRVEDPSPARYRALFRAIKFCRLLHNIRPAPRGGYEIRLDGPLSLFRSSQRYGVQMALFLPTLLHLERFELTADVLHGPARQQLEFRLDSEQRLAPVGRLQGQWRPDEVDWLTERFEKLGSDWEISPDAELVDLGGQGILIADWVFVHRPSGLRVFLELLGYWRRGSLRSRLEVLREHGPPNLILAVSRELHVEEEAIEDLPGEVLVFRAAPLARDVLAALERLRSAGS